MDIFGRKRIADLEETLSVTLSELKSERRLYHNCLDQKVAMRDSRDMAYRASAHLTAELHAAEQALFDIANMPTANCAHIGKRMAARALQALPARMLPKVVTPMVRFATGSNDASALGVVL